MIISNLILITIIFVIVTDLTDFPDFLNRRLWKILFKVPYNGKQFKLLSCSLCQSWWMMLLYLILTHNLTIPYIALSLTFSFLTPVIKETLLFIKDFFLKVLDELYYYFKIF